VIDLYERVEPGAKIVVLNHSSFDLRRYAKALRDVGDRFIKNINDATKDL
jgi:hypothetical protein